MYKEIKTLYDSLADEESKMIFRQRLLFSLTNDWNCIRDMLICFRNTDKDYYDLIDVMAQPELLRDKEIILFGTGGWLRAVEEIIKNCGLDSNGYCDNDPARAGKVLNGKKIISVVELLRNHKEAMVVIASEQYENEMIAQLQREKFPHNQIIHFSYCRRKIYFDDEIVQPVEDEVFVDGGSFDGSNSLDFHQWCHGKTKMIYAFEPDKANAEKCMENLKHKLRADFEVINAGLWSKKDTLHFRESHSVDSRIEEEGKISVPVTSIDEAVSENVTFIKMDIEGAELKALKGAAGMIQRNKPRLAVCVYHKPEDILEIPSYIKKLVPEYKLYLRHYIPYHYDTVLYAVIEKNDVL